MNDLEFINYYRKQMNSARDICLQNKIDYSNLLKGKVSNKKIKLVADSLKKQIISMYDDILFDKIFMEVEENVK